MNIELTAAQIKDIRFALNMAQGRLDELGEFDRSTQLSETCKEILEQQREQSA